MISLDDYEIIKELGKGRTSTVYLAAHPKFGEVALKKLHPGIKDDVMPNGRRVKELLFDEFIVLTALRQQLATNSLPLHYVPEIFEHDLEHNPFIAISVAPGIPVDLLLEKNPNGLDEPVAIAIMHQFLILLEQLHTGLQRTYVDMQLGNLFWHSTPEEPSIGTLMVIDWNVVSPEAKNPQSDEFNKRVKRDIMLAGVFLLRLLTNRLASLKGISLLELQKLERWSSLSRKTRNLLADLLSLDPHQRRYQAAADLKKELNELDKRWHMTPRNVKIEIKVFEDEYDDIPDSENKESLLIKWALDVDEWLPMLARQGTSKNQAAITNLRQKVDNFFSDDLTADLIRGRIFFEGASYDEALTHFQRAEKAGLGLQAVRWCWLTEFALSGKPTFAPNRQLLSKALFALDKKQWEAPPLQEQQGRPLLHTYFAIEAKIRHCLTQEDGFEAAREAENRLEQLPAPEYGSQQEYLDKLRLEIGNLAEQIKQDEQAATVQAQQTLERETLEKSWQQFKRTAAATKESAFKNFLDQLETTLAKDRSNTEWLGWILQRSRELGDKANFKQAGDLLSLTMGYSCQLYQENRDDDLLTAVANERHLAYLLHAVHDWLDKDAPARQALIEQLNRSLFLFERIPTWKSPLVRTLQTKWELAPDNNDLLALLYQLDPTFNPDPVLKRQQILQEAEALLQQQKAYTALSSLFPYQDDRLAAGLTARATTQIEQAKEDLQLFARRKEHFQLCQLLSAWLEREPGQRELLDVCREHWQTLLIDNQLDLAHGLQKQVETYRENLRLPDVKGVDALAFLAGITEKLLAWEEDLRPLELREWQSRLAALDKMTTSIVEAAKPFIIKKLQSFIHELSEEALLPLVGLGVMLTEKKFTESAKQLRERQRHYLTELWITGDRESRQGWEIFLNKSVSESVYEEPQTLLSVLEFDPELWLVCLEYVRRVLLKPPNGITVAKENLAKIRETFARKGLISPTEMIGLESLVIDWLEPLQEANQHNNPKMFVDKVKELDPSSSLWGRAKTSIETSWAKASSQTSIGGSSPENLRSQKLSRLEKQDWKVMSRWFPFWLENLKSQTLFVADVESLQRVARHIQVETRTSIEPLLTTLKQQALVYEQQQRDQEQFDLLTTRLTNSVFEWGLDFERLYKQLETETYRKRAIILLEQQLEHQLQPIDHLIQNSTGHWELKNNDLTSISSSDLKVALDLLHTLLTLVLSPHMMGKYLSRRTDELQSIYSSLNKENERREQAIIEELEKEINELFQQAEQIQDYDSGWDILSQINEKQQLLTPFSPHKANYILNKLRKHQDRVLNLPKLESG